MVLKAGLTEEQMAQLETLLSKLDWGGTKSCQPEWLSEYANWQPEDYGTGPNWHKEVWQPDTRALSFQNKLVSQGVWNGLTGAVTTTCVELTVLRLSGRQVEMLFIPRPPTDTHYPGGLLHAPGSVMYGHEPQPWTLARIHAKELASVPITRPAHIGYQRSNGARGPEIATHFGCILLGEYTGRGAFYPIDDLPENHMIPHHVPLAYKARRWFVLPE